MSPWLLLIPAGYLFGSFPSAYVLGRLYGLDIRRMGSGNVGGSNIATFVGPWAFLLAGGVDVVKAALPTFIAVQWAGDLNIGVLTGLAAIAGHDWSLYLRLRGGRGISATVGALLPLFPLGVAVILIPSLLGKPLHREALGCGLGFIALPFAAWLLGQPPALVLGCMGITILAAIKRLLANGEPVPHDRRFEVLRNRLLHDRDVGPDEPWVERTSA